MGGLAGTIGAQGAPGTGWEQLLQAMPHENGMVRSVFSENNVTLLHCGAARAENGTGGWPMSRRFDGRTLTAVLDGEIQNAAALRDELQQKGHAFHTQNQTELVLISYIEWGTASPERFSGDFAFCIWDSVQKELFVAGGCPEAKPLFFVFDEDGLAFATSPVILQDSAGEIIELYNPCHMVMISDIIAMR